MAPRSLTAISLGLLLYLLVGSSLAASANRYPQEALKCFSTQAAKGETICPIDRSNYCVKEESTVSRSDCGSVDPHRFDVWDRRLGKCVYRKCAASCLNDTVATFGDAEQYERSIYCCAKNKCNGSVAVTGSTLAITLSVGVLAYLLR